MITGAGTDIWQLGNQFMVTDILCDDNSFVVEGRSKHYFESLRQAKNNERNERFNA